MLRGLQEVQRRTLEPASVRPGRGHRPRLQRDRVPVGVNPTGTFVSIRVHSWAEPCTLGLAVTDIREPPMDADDWADFRRGVALFNAGRFWHAHEAWEEVWKRKRAFPAHNFFRGLIQLAAAHHQREQGRFDGMLIHFERVRTKLTPFAPAFLDVPVNPLLESVNVSRQEALRLGRDRLTGFDRALIPVIRCCEAGIDPDGVS